MKSSRQPFTCIQCLLRRPPTSRRLHHSSRLGSSSPGAKPNAASATASVSRPTAGPKAVIDLKHIRQNPDLHRQNCLDRNYRAAASAPARINELFAAWQVQQRSGRALRERGNLLRLQLANPAASEGEEGEAPEAAALRSLSGERLLEEARSVKAQLGAIEAVEASLVAEMDALALALPNLTCSASPRGEEPRLLGYINDHPEAAPVASDRVWRSHIHIGTELGLIDFAAAGTTSGWGWYYLLDEAAQLEQALVSYALATATKAGWRQVSPPSMVYGHIAAACGFQPRDNNGETQVYSIAQSPEDAARGKPELVMAGTAEIPLAGMKAGETLDETAMPMKRVAVSRCYRAEAGARGVDTKGLYRVHEFTKVEMFAWTAPEEAAAEDAWNEMVDLQTEILGSLGLHCRILEMPTTDLGASAFRKCDIEAFFPSRRDRNDGWGEVTSASICTDYQTRRLGTRLKMNGKTVWPYTVNGTALAVPRVLAAILEHGWDEEDASVEIPEVLRPWMDGKERIGLKHRLR